MANEKKSSAGSIIAGVVVGALLMVGGMYISQKYTSPELGEAQFLHSINEQGIPLDLGKTVAIIGVFFILFPVINFFFVKPLSAAIGERTTELENTFSEAEQLRSEMNSMRSDYERRLAQKEAEAREQIQAQIKEAQNLRQTLMSEAAAKADDLVKRANTEIENERTRVLSELRLEVVNLTLSATEKLIGENMDSEKNRRLVNEFIDKVEVKA